MMAAINAKTKVAPILRVIPLSIPILPLPPLWRRRQEAGLGAAWPDQGKTSAEYGGGAALQWGGNRAKPLERAGKSASVDENVLPRDVASLGAREIRAQLAELFGPAESSRRNPRLPF